MWFVLKKKKNFFFFSFWEILTEKHIIKLVWPYDNMVVDVVHFFIIILVEYRMNLVVQDAKLFTA